MRKHNYTAIVLGGTGLVGKSLVKQLAEDPRYSSVICLVRELKSASAKALRCNEKISLIKVNYNTLNQHSSAFAVNHVYCCLGSTIKKAGSKKAFRQIDYDYVLCAAKLAVAEGASGFIWVSSVGANANSGSFYLQVKGQLEDAIAALVQPTADSERPTYAQPVRPSLLLGDRSEFRLGERLATVPAKLLAPFMFGKLKQYRPIQASEVAAQMIALQTFEP